LPLHEPTLYALTELRAMNRSTSTIQQALRSVMVLYLVLGRLDVDLDQRMHEGRLLTLGEVDELSRWCRASLVEVLSDSAMTIVPASTKVVSLEKARMRTASRAAQEEVGADSAAIRVHYILAYLEWRATERLLKLGPRHPVYAELKTAAELACRALRERVPSSGGRNTVRQRQGLTAEARAKLLSVIEPTSPENPWTGRHPRQRNALMVRLLLALGLRRGELLIVRISDISFQSNEVLIPRRPDDPEDPRLDQPQTKTNDRLLPLDDDLARQTRDYIMGSRRAIVGARKHQFLFVANGSGRPMTKAAVNKVFDAMRRKCADLPEELSPHVLRHTWNDDFSEVMDRKQVPEEAEKKMRSRLMGWSETSDTAATYTRRYIKRKADEAMLDLQKNLKKDKNE
jgi:integrase